VKSRRLTWKGRRWGLTTIETVVALGVLATATTGVATLLVKHFHLAGDARAMRVAVEEVSNRLAVVTAKPQAAVREAVEALARVQLDGPLEGASLRGETQALDGGLRITVTLDWPGEPSRRPPVTLVGWSFYGKESQ
jgi:hypothetical protein